MQQQFLGHTSGRMRATQAFLLAIVASGPLWNNIQLANVGGYPVTVVTVAVVLLIGLGAIDWLTVKWVPVRNMLPVLVLVLYELLVHGLLAGAVENSEWIKSFALLCLCVGLVVSSIGLRMRPHTLRTLLTAMNGIAYLMGSLGVLQFFLANTVGLIWQPLPLSSLVNVVDMGQDAYRFAGLVRSTGVSHEPSFYGIGMVVVAFWCHLLRKYLPADGAQRRIQTGATALALIGAFLSVSFSAWALLAALLFSWMLSATERGITRRQNILASFKIAFLFLVAAVFLYPFVEARFENAYSSWDYRLVGSVALIAMPAGFDLPLSVLTGTGLGLEGDSSRLLDVYTRDLAFGDRPTITIVNGWAYVAVTMGWIGLLVNLWIVVATLRRRGVFAAPALPFLVLLLGYFFMIGRYLDPDWWGLLVLVGSLRASSACHGSGSRASPVGPKGGSRRPTAMTRKRGPLFRSGAA